MALNATIFVASLGILPAAVEADQGVVPYRWCGCGFLRPSLMRRVSPHPEALNGLPRQFAEYLQNRADTPNQCPMLGIDPKPPSPRLLGARNGFLRVGNG